MLNPSLPLPPTKRRTPKLPTRSEAALQQQLIAMLAGLGYRCFETGKGRKKVTCRTCGASDYPTGWQGNTPGLPDVYVTCNAWPFGMQIGLELKGAKTEVRPEQREAIEAGRNILVRDLLKPVMELLWYENMLERAGVVGSADRAARLKRCLTMNEGRLQ